MKKLFSVVAVALQLTVVGLASLSVAQVAHAQQVYVGASVTTPGEGNWTYAPGKSIANYDHSLSKKFYGGVELQRDVSIEVGYLDWGYRFQVPAAGSQKTETLQTQVNMTMLYTAAKFNMSVSDHWALFAKAGVARIQADFGGQRSDDHLRALVGFGVEYSVTKQLGLLIGFDRAGSIGGTPQQKLEAGIKWRF